MPKQLTDFLNEAFNSPVAYIWRWRDNEADFDIQDPNDPNIRFQYTVSFIRKNEMGDFLPLHPSNSSEEKRQFEVILSLDSVYDSEKKQRMGVRTFNGTSSLGNTGTGSALQVFSTVLAITKEFIKKTRPRSIVFSGDKSFKKDNLYGMMLKNKSGELKSLGYNLNTHEKNNSTVFVLEKS